MTENNRYKGCRTINELKNYENKWTINSSKHSQKMMPKPTFRKFVDLTRPMDRANNGKVIQARRTSNGEGTVTELGTRCGNGQVTVD